jgi:hypothetical protein
MITLIKLVPPTLILLQKIILNYLFLYFLRSKELSYIRQFACILLHIIFIKRQFLTLN